MVTVPELVVLIAYLSLLVELTVLHVPSVASSRRIWMADDALVTSYSLRFRRFFALSKTAKVVIFFVPVLVSWATFVYPLVAIARGGDPIGDFLFQPTSGTDAAAIFLVFTGRLITLNSVVVMRRLDGHLGGPSGLRRSGIFRWSRNPGLAGMYLFVLGVWLTVPSLLMSVGIVCYIAYMDFKVRMEEDFLENTFGEEYRVYRLRTGRYFS